MADKVKLELVTPSRLLLETETDMVVVPGGDGDFGVLPGHAPLLSTLRPGTLAVYEDDAVSERLFVAGGFAEVGDNRCVVLAEEALPVAEITAEMVTERLKDAREKVAAAETDKEKEDAERGLKIAEALEAGREASA
ncbi:MAG: ATP synthase F1 subunit epsilon [Rhodospirillales bacterium]|jgi:F-type H+-transporting ATPase subunit epsilon|nr:ATP synthase F1 subunit epsilon [Rhodospirillales bacterium]